MPFIVLLRNKTVYLIVENQVQTSFRLST